MHIILIKYGILSYNLIRPRADWPFFSWDTIHVHSGIIDKKYISKYLEISEIGAMLGSFPSGFNDQGVLNKDLAVWLYGYIPYVCYYKI
jgi:hypothetical protein